jgi:hypothetical protein
MTTMRPRPVAAGLQPGGTAGLKACGYVLAWALASAPLLACPICFQVDDGPATAGIRAAVVVLGGVTVSVLTGFAAFIVRFVRRTAA